MSGMFDQLYCQGYFAACQDLYRLIEDAKVCLASDHKKLNEKMIMRVLTFVVVHHIILREDPDISIAWNVDRQCWVLFNRRTHRTEVSER